MASPGWSAKSLAKSETNRSKGTSPCITAPWIPSSHAIQLSQHRRHRTTQHTTNAHRLPSHSIPSSPIHASMHPGIRAHPKRTVVTLPLFVLNLPACRHRTASTNCQFTCTVTTHDLPQPCTDTLQRADTHGREQSYTASRQPGPSSRHGHATANAARTDELTDGNLCLALQLLQPLLHVPLQVPVGFLGRNRQRRRRSNKTTQQRDRGV
jgi:hypothetical protein